MTEPSGIEPGDNAPNFQLPNANSRIGGESLSLAEVSGENGTVVMFTCNHCPYVVGSEPRIEAMAAKARDLGMGFVGINSNDPVMYESDNWENMQKRATKGMTYSYLHDSSQDIAHAYGAERTPEFYLLNSNNVVVYRGRLDDSPKNPNEATTSELAEAMDSLGAGHNIANSRTQSIGCSVKWK